jgi:Putative DNA-binding domain
MSAEYQSSAEYLVNNLSESKAVEHKAWINPQTPEGRAKIVKALIALRNNGDGGALLIGVDDKTRKLSAPSTPIDTRLTFKEDVIQALIAKYAAPVFEVSVEFVEVAPNTYPVIIVTGGITAPVMCKSDLLDASGQRLLKQKTIYVRTVRHGNVSTTEADGEDLKDLIETCVANREVDYSRFLTKLFRGLQPHEFRAALVGAQELVNETSRVVGNTDLIRNDSLKRFALATEKTGLAPQKFGFRDIALLIDSPQQPNGPRISSSLRRCVSQTRILAGGPRG